MWWIEIEEGEEGHHRPRCCSEAGGVSMHPSQSQSIKDANRISPIDRSANRFDFSKCSSSTGLVSGGHMI